MAVEIKIPMMIQDPDSPSVDPGTPGKMRYVEEFEVTQEAFFLDGPVSEQVAILDFDPQTGELLPGAVFIPPPPGKRLGKYQLPREGGHYDFRDLDFLKVSVFTTILRTMYMFAEPDALGRKLRWAFPGTQLLVIPRAGNWANAFYERDSHSLQFFFFADKSKPGNTVYTSLSRDIIAHETAHAILDGIAPDLYNAITPQSLALHEGLADLTALLLAFRSGNLREMILKETRGSIKRPTAFSSVAEEFGRARDPIGKRAELRSVYNNKTLDSDDTSLDEHGNPNRVTRTEPHELSMVLSGALYKVMVKLHDRVRKEIAAERGISTYSASGYALFKASEVFKRMIFRALDYLPPGEVSFADYARAIIAADQAAHPEDTEEREWLVAEFVRRRIVPNRRALQVRTNYFVEPLMDVDLDSLVESDWAAYQFADTFRKFLNIPPQVPFYVRPRLVVEKRYYHRDEVRLIKELVFKVSWQHTEENPDPLRRRFSESRQIVLGTTLMIDWETHMVRALLTTAPRSQPSQLVNQLQLDRDAYLLQLSQAGKLNLAHSGDGGSAVTSGVILSDGLMVVRGTARNLHLDV